MAALLKQLGNCLSLCLLTQSICATSAFMLLPMPRGLPAPAAGITQRNPWQFSCRSWAPHQATPRMG
eukprot:11959772-Alexandrium_andersonii.AAC.1